MVEANDDSEHDYYKTQYALLKSRSLAAQVIHDLGLQDNPLFSGSISLRDCWEDAGRNSNRGQGDSRLKRLRRVRNPWRSVKIHSREFPGLKFLS